MNKTVWGPAVWKSFHYTALGFPKNPCSIDKQHYLKYYESFMYVLPCEECRQHYKHHLSKMPLGEHLGDTKSLFCWTVEMHNRVNRSIGKKEWTCEDAWVFYLNRKSNNNYIIALICLVILYIVYTK